MSDETIPTAEEKLRNQIASAEEKLDRLKAKLWKLTTNQTGEKGPLTAIDLLWQAALPMSRCRSSKQQCRTAWGLIPISARPTNDELLHALKTWNKCEQWKAEGGVFVPGLHRFIKHRMWEDLPEVSDPMSRYKNPPKPAPEKPAPQDTVTDRAEIKRLLGIKK